MKHCTTKILIMLGLISSTSFNGVFAQAMEEVTINKTVADISIEDVRKELKVNMNLLSTFNDEEIESILYRVDNFNLLLEDEQSELLGILGTQISIVKEGGPTDPSSLTIDIQSTLE